MSCSDPTFCRDGCCRSFAGTEFCDIESSCVANPTLLIILVPAALGVVALVLIIIVICRLRNRKVINLHDEIYKDNGKIHVNYPVETERTITERQLRSTRQ